MNLGGRRISNQELGAVFAGLGFREVHTFRASGNVSFESQAEPERQLSERIEAGLAAALGYQVPTFLRDAEELRAIAAHEPFPAAVVSAGAGKLQVDILAARPHAAARRAVLALSDERDRLAFGERELYWLPSGGTLESELDLVAIERILGQATRRTKGTIEQLAAKHFPT